MGFYLGLGRHSGSGGIIHVLNAHGLEVSAGTARRLLERVRDYAEVHKGNVPEPLLVEWLVEDCD